MGARRIGILDATIHPYLWGLLPDNDRVLERWAREIERDHHERS
jgi:HipA-like protein